MPALPALLFSASLVAGPASAAARESPFSEKQIRFLADKGNSAQQDAQWVYHYFKSGQDWTVPSPRWLAGRLPELEKREAWKDAQGKALSEAELWRRPPSVLFEFFEITRETFPDEHLGRKLAPALLLARYRENRAAFLEALNPLHLARLHDSLEGRGKLIIRAYDTVLRDMNALHDAVRDADLERYVRAVLEVGAQAKRIRRILHEPPPGTPGAESSRIPNDRDLPGPEPDPKPPDGGVSAPAREPAPRDRVRSAE